MKARSNPTPADGPGAPWVESSSPAAHGSVDVRPIAAERLLAGLRPVLDAVAEDALRRSEDLVQAFDTQQHGE